MKDIYKLARLPLAVLALGLGSSATATAVTQPPEPVLGSATNGSGYCETYKVLGGQVERCVAIDEGIPRRIESKTLRTFVSRKPDNSVVRDRYTLSHLKKYNAFGKLTLNYASCRLTRRFNDQSPQKMPCYLPAAEKKIKTVSPAESTPAVYSDYRQLIPVGSIARAA